MIAAQTIHMQPEQIPLSRLAPLWGQGVGIAVRTGASLQDLLCGQLGIDADYLQHRIQTIIVNGRAVDEPDELPIRDGDVIALSTAMPGLVGTTLRKGGHLAAMRADISQQSASPASSSGAGMVTLKLFNLVAREIGPRVIARGIWIQGSDAAYLLEGIDAPSAPAVTAGPADWVELTVGPSAS